MTSDKLARLSQAASIIRDVIGCEFEWETPGHRPYGQRAVMLLIHGDGSALRPYCNYDCEDYQKIEALSYALAQVGLYAEDCTGDYSGVYEVSNACASSV